MKHSFFVGLGKGLALLWGVLAVRAISDVDQFLEPRTMEASSVLDVAALVLVLALTALWLYVAAEEVRKDGDWSGR